MAHVLIQIFHTDNPNSTECANVPERAENIVFRHIHSMLERLTCPSYFTSAQAAKLHGEEKNIDTQWKRLFINIHQQVRLV